MPKLEHIPPLPMEREYLAAIHKVGADIEYSGMHRFFDLGNAGTRSERGIIQTSSRLGSIVEPVDRSLDVFRDETTAGGLALVKGVLAGFHVARIAHEELFTIVEINRALYEKGKKIERLVSMEEEVDDPLERRHKQASYIIDAGEQGLECIGQESQDLLESWEQIIITDVTKQRMFRVGAGIVVIAAHQAHLTLLAQQETERLRTQAQSNLAAFTAGQVPGSVDWDKEWLEFSSSNPETPPQP